ncbi:hypothetical protein [Actinoallomurus rhizosphaericola]|uniref:hypothetical protein n=1 Tax=Actinoallomurus rhizosphaericola TaxID=2952536 RepID=UPI002093E4D4|nr:hypothetical protein [Actinoallomurus rhizosphaericola]MCO5998435.1 hypothetical protein [Actinoallomurus rhizosphaericola]
MASTQVLSPEDLVDLDGIDLDIRIEVAPAIQGGPAIYTNYVTCHQSCTCTSSVSSPTLSGNGCC